MLAELTGSGVPSEQQLLDWLRVSPRTLGWDAIAAYDRVRTNQILMQDYITRFNGSGLLPPVTDTIEIVHGERWRHLYDYRMDAPRLSFERSGFDRSECTLTMRIVGGTELLVRRYSSHRSRRVTRVDWIDALQGPKLTAVVSLSSAKATLTTAGKVQLNLADATRFELTSFDDQLGRELGGTFFQELFKRLPASKKVFVLTTLGKLDGRAVFKTGEFAIRVFPAPGSARRGAAEYGDGAVVVFVASSNSLPGNLPSSTAGWTYPIPAGRSTTLLIGHHFLLRTLLQAGWLNASPESRLRFENTTNLSVPVGKITLEAATATARGVYYAPPSPFSQLYCWIIALPLKELPALGTASFAFEITNGRLVYDWTGNTSRPLDACLDVTTMRPLGLSSFSATWATRREYQFTHAADGALVLAPVHSSGAGCAVAARNLSSQHLDHAAVVTTAARNHLQATIDATFDSLLVPCGEIDIFRSRGLLFESDNTVVLESVHFPMDLACFGQLGPAIATFAVEPLEAKVAAGKQLQFRVVPAQSNVTWTLEPLDDETAPMGQVSSAGLYSAPSCASVTGTQRLVRVTASASGRSSSALVRVLKREVVSNPLVAITATNGGRIRLSGGTLDGTTPTWSLNSSIGSRLEPIPADSGLEFEPGDIYYVPGPDQPSTVPVVVDQVTATHPHSNKTHTSRIVVTMNPMMAEARVSRPAGMHAGQVKLELWGEIGVIEGAEWSLVAGGGSVSSTTGVYSSDPNSEFRFAVIVGIKRVSGFSVADCLILPVPLLDLEEIVRVTEPSVSTPSLASKEH